MPYKIHQQFKAFSFILDPLLHTYVAIYTYIKIFFKTVIQS